jgi:hypothetical protein
MLEIRDTVMMGVKMVALGFMRRLFGVSLPAYRKMIPRFGYSVAASFFPFTGFHCTPHIC